MRKKTRLFMNRVMASVLCTVMLLTSTGMASVADGSVPDLAPVESTIVEGIASDSNLSTDSDVASDSDLATDSNAQFPEDDPDMEGEDPDDYWADFDQELENDLEEEAVPDEEQPENDIESARKAFLDVYQAFADVFEGERMEHGQEGHVCQFAKFEDVLVMAQDVQELAVAELLEDTHVVECLDSLDAMLSVAAASAYVSRGNAILNIEYRDLDAFDLDVAYADGLFAYMQEDALAYGDVLQMQQELSDYREELAYGLANPDVLADVSAILEQYEVFCSQADTMLFDEFAMQARGIQDRMSVLPEEAWTDELQAVSDGLSAMLSEHALDEFANRVKDVRQDALEGRYDLSYEYFDKDASLAWFAEIRGLSVHMREQELVSTSYLDGISVLDNLESVLNGESLSEQAVVFLEKAKTLQSELDTVYAKRPYKLTLAVKELLTECSALTGFDQVHESVVSMKDELENIKRRIVLDIEIKDFLDAVYALLDAAGAEDFDIESDMTVQLAKNVAMAMDKLTDEKLLDIEVQDAMTALLAAGLMDVINTTELAPYEIEITWLDTGNCELSNNNTHADYTVTSALGSNVSVGDSFRVDIMFNEDVPSDTKLLYIPPYMAEHPFSEEYGLLPADTESAVWSRYFSNSSAFRSVVGLKTSHTAAGCTVLTDRTITAGTKFSIPVRDAFMTNVKVTHDGGSVTSTSTSTISFDFDGSLSYCFTDGLKREHILTFERTGGVEQISVEQSKLNTFPITGNKNSRVWNWLPSIETYYGVSKEAFQAGLDSGNLFFEYKYYVNGSTGVVSGVDFEAVASHDGTVHGMDVRSGYSNQNYGTPGYEIKGDALMDVSDSHKRVICHYGDNLQLPVSSAGNVASSYSSMLIGSLFFTNTSSPVHHGYLVNVLVSYKADDIVDLQTGTTSADCTLTATLRALYSGETISDSHTIIHSEPFTKIDTEGDIYSFSITGASVDFSDYALPTLLLGMDSPDNSYIEESAVGTYKFLDGAQPDDVVLSIDAVGMSTGDASEPTVLLGSGDYRMHSVRIQVEAGEAYWTDTGSLANVVTDLDAYGSDEIEVYVCTDDSPTEWILDQVVSVRDCHNLLNLVLGHDNVIRVRVDYNGRRSFVRMRVCVRIGLRHDGPVVSQIVDGIRKLPDSDSYSNYYSRVFGSLMCTNADGTPNIKNPASHVTGALAGELNQLSSVLYEDLGYTGAEYPFRAMSGFGHMYLQGFYSYMALSDASLLDNNQRVLEHHTYVQSYLSFEKMLAAIDSNAGSVLQDAPVMGLDTAEYYIVVPKEAEVVDVVPGLTSVLKPMQMGGVQVLYGYRFSRVSASSCYLMANEDYLPKPDISYEIMDYGECSVLHVTSRLSYDRYGLFRFKDDAYKIFNNLYFGNFTVVTRPRYSDLFISSADTLVQVGGFLHDGSGNAYKGDKVFKFCNDNGTSSLGVQNALGIKYLSDLNKNGNTTERIGMFGYRQATFTDGAYVSGMSVAAKGTATPFYNTTVGTEPRDPYTYRLTYSQMAETSKNVVLFDSLEDVEGNDWTGFLYNIDLSDVKKKGLPVKVYANADRIDSVSYVADNVTAADLEAGMDGWYLLAECSTENGYDVPIQWTPNDGSDIKSVAFDFGETEFANNQEGKPNNVVVYLGMRPYSEHINNGSFGHGDNFVRNRGFFSDMLLATNKHRSVMSNTVTVNLNTDVSHSISKTIDVSKNLAQGDTDTWITQIGEGDAMDKASHVTLDKNGTPADSYVYAYDIRYELDAPGTGRYNSIDTLVIYDDLESGTNSRFGGQLTGIQVSGLTHVQSSINIMSGRSVILHPTEGDNRVVLSEQDVELFISYQGMTPDEQLPDYLIKTTGRSDWQRYSPGDDLPENVRAIAAVPYLAMSAMNTTDAYLNIRLEMRHAGRTDVTGSDRILKNGVTLGFVPDGTHINDMQIEEHPDLTEIEVLYRPDGVVLPMTGGPGTDRMLFAGLVCIAAVWVLLYRRRSRRDA